MFEKALKLLKTKKILPNFKERAYEIVENACDVWGHLYSLKSCYEGFYEDYEDFDQ